MQKLLEPNVSIFLIFYFLIDPNCNDIYPHCDRYKYRCNSSQTDAITKWVARECKKTCGFC